MPASPTPATISAEARLTSRLRQRDPIFGLVFRAFLVLFGFVVFAQHFAIRIHFHANLLSILLDDGFKVGAFLFPTDNSSALGLRLGSRLHRSRDLRAVDALSFVFLFSRLRGTAERQPSAHRA